MERVLKIFNAILFAAMIAANMLGEWLKFGGNTIADISNKYTNLFTPAPITFSIWGVIYCLVFLYVLEQLRANSGFSWGTGVLFALSCMFNICWVFSWHYDKIGLSMFFMVGLLLSLIGIVTSMQWVKSFRSVQNASLIMKLSYMGFCIYLGWICAATIANVSVLLTKMQWNGFGISPSIWTLAVIIVGAIIGVLFILMKENYWAAIAIAWAYVGILIRHVNITVTIGAAVGIVMIVLAAGVMMVW